MAQPFNSTPQYNSFNQPDQSAAIENLVAQTKALIQQIQITNAPYAYSNKVFQPPNDIIENPTTLKKRESQSTTIKPVGKVFPKKTLLFTKLTPDQREEVLRIVYENFPEVVDDRQIPEVLKFSIKIIKELINEKKEEAKEASSPPAAAAIRKSYEVPEVVPEIDLDGLIDGYLEYLDTWLSESKKACPPKVLKNRDPDNNDNVKMDSNKKDDDWKTIVKETNKKIIGLVSDKGIVNNDSNKDWNKGLIKEIKNKRMRLGDRFEDSMIGIENSMNKVENESPDIIDPWLRYILIDWPLPLSSIPEEIFAYAPYDPTKRIMCHS
ncbi:16573_t:CDS:2 [Racocetra fulgida]|uniref:16573_t:CDS:1 n=1 Tax=Racocetra fulgida TaxID=60492 RepID=A0A9N9DUX7_9GLOM|nr:16573_t:CDS:2 [Racocetra fulgida]